MTRVDYDLKEKIGLSFVLTEALNDLKPFCRKSCYTLLNLSVVKSVIRTSLEFLRLAAFVQAPVPYLSISCLASFYYLSILGFKLRSLPFVIYRG